MHYATLLTCNSLTSSSDQLTIEDLQTVKNELWDARTLWKSIGDVLGIDDETLKSIAKDQDSQGDCLRECLAKWLSGGAETSAVQRQPRSWRTIVDALRTPSVNRQSLAERIEKEYCTSQDDQQSCQEQVPLSQTPEQLLVLPCKKCTLYTVIGTEIT